MTFTSQEKIAIVFLAAAVFAGSLLSLIKKQHPVFFSQLTADGYRLPRRKINIHSAAQEEWESLPGIGAYRARMIIAERQRRGRFSSVNDVRYVKGIGPHVFNQIKDFLSDD